MADSRSGSIIPFMKITRPTPLSRLLPGVVILLIAGFSLAFAAPPQENADGGQAATVPAEDPKGAPGADPGVSSPPSDRSEACTDGGELGPIRVQIGAVEAIASVGQVMPLPVRVKGVCNLGGFKLWLTYNHSVTRLVDVQPAPFLAGDPPVDTRFVDDDDLCLTSVILLANGVQAWLQNIEAVVTDNDD